MHPITHNVGSFTSVGRKEAKRSVIAKTAWHHRIQADKEQHWHNIGQQNGRTNSICCDRMPAIFRIHSSIYRISVSPLKEVTILSVPLQIQLSSL